MSTNNKYKGPLTGLNVIDFGHYYAGPMAAMLLAEQGANVIRIVKPGKNELPEQQNRLLNRNKKLLMLDLKTADGKAQALTLIKKADVLIENFRPGVMQRLGLDYASVKRNNPSLIYLSLPGFASTDKARAHIQAWEGVVAAAACVYTTTHRYRYMMNFPPLYTSVPVSSAHASMQGAVAVMAALMAREQCQYGTLIEVPLVDAGLSVFESAILFADYLANIPDFLDPFRYTPEDSQKTQLKKLNQGIQRATMSPFYVTPHVCANNSKLVIGCVGHARHIETFLTVLGIYSQLIEEGFVNQGPWKTGLGNNLSGVDGLDDERGQRLRNLIADTLLSKTAEQWESLLHAAGFPASLVRTRKQWLSLEANHRSALLTTMDNGHTVLTVPGRIVDVTGPEDTVMDTTQHEVKPITISQANELLDQNFSSNRAVKDRATDAVSSAMKKGDMLKGLKVLDLSNILAGPTASYTLAQYGADIIRLEPPQGVNHSYFTVPLDVGQGKRTILVDIKKAQGRQIFNQLIAWADVLTHNCLDDVAVGLGISQEQLQAINPQVISCQISAYGGTHRGGWEALPGYDTTVQAVSGIMTHYGSDNDPHDHGPISCGDIMGGVSLAFATLLSVYQRCKTGVAGEARTSLARAMNYSQLPYMIGEHGACDWGEPGGQFAVGKSWWQRLYACSDGWLYVGTRRERSRILADIVLDEKMVSLEGYEEKALEQAFAGNTCAAWQAALDKGGIASHRVLVPMDIATQPAHVVSNEYADRAIDGPLEMLCRPDHPFGSAVKFIPPAWVRIGEGQNYKLLSVPKRLGEHSRIILQDLGYDGAQIDALIDGNVVYEYLTGIGNKERYC